MSSEQLSELQLAFMQALWEVGEGTVSDVQAALERQGRRLAPTTVATVLRRLAEQGWVLHRQEARRFLYKAAVTKRHTSRRILTRLTNSLFGGDLPAVVSQLLDARSVDRAELDELKRLIAEKERKLK